MLQVDDEVSDTDDDNDHLYNDLNNNPDNIGNNTSDFCKYIDGILYRKKEVIIEATSVKSALLSIVNDPKFWKCFNSEASDYNQISVEGNFLLYIYLLFCAHNNIDIPITKTTINRCMAFLITGKPKTTRSTSLNKNEEAILRHVIKEHFGSYQENRTNLFHHTEKSFMKPLENLGNQYYTNLLLHMENYENFQKKYIKTKLINTFSETELPKRDRTFMSFLIQKRINGKVFVPRKPKTQMRIKSLYTKMTSEKINPFIAHEIKLLRSYIDLSEKVNEKNIMRRITYFYNMLKYMKSVGAKGFTLIPIFKPKMKFIRFGPEALSRIYNSVNGTKINVLDFKKNIDKYFNEMFCIKEKFSNIVKNYPFINSIQTDGVQVALTFSKRKTIWYIDDAEMRKKVSDDKRIKNAANKDQYIKELTEADLLMKNKKETLKKLIKQKEKYNDLDEKIIQSNSDLNKAINECKLAERIVSVKLLECDLSKKLLIKDTKRFKKLTNITIEEYEKKYDVNPNNNLIKDPLDDLGDPDDLDLEPDYDNHNEELNQNPDIQNLYEEICNLRNIINCSKNDQDIKAYTKSKRQVTKMKSISESFEELKKNEDDLFKIEQEITDIENLLEEQEIKECDKIDLANEIKDTTKQHTGLYDIKYLKCSKEFLDNFQEVGLDPGNQIMADISTTNNIHFTVNKNEYNDLAHITSGNEKIRKFQDKMNMEHIYEQLSHKCYSTSDINEFISDVE